MFIGQGALDSRIENQRFLEVLINKPSGTEESGTGRSIGRERKSKKT